jgi:hypothetical protein
MTWLSANIVAQMGILNGNLMTESAKPASFKIAIMLSWTETTWVQTLIVLASRKSV